MFIFIPQHKQTKKENKYLFYSMKEHSIFVGVLFVCVRMRLLPMFMVVILWTHLHFEILLSPFSGEYTHRKYHCVHILLLFVWIQLPTLHSGCICSARSLRTAKNSARSDRKTLCWMNLLKCAICRCPGSSEHADIFSKNMHIIEQLFCLCSI